MNMNQFTQKTMAALQRAQSLAMEYQHMQVEQEHLMLALTENDGELIPQLLRQCGWNVDSLRRQLTDALGRIPRVSGPGREADKVYISPDVEKALVESEARAKQMKDEYLSVEHLWMGLCAKASSRVQQMLKSIGYDEETFLKALAQVRGATRVPQDQEQPRPHRRARRGQNRRGGGSGPKDRPGRRAGFPEGSHHLLPGHGQPDRRREVPWRVRGAAEGRAGGNQEERGQDHPLH